MEFKADREGRKERKSPMRNAKKVLSKKNVSRFVRPFEFVIFHFASRVLFSLSIIHRAYPWTRNWNRAHFLPPVRRGVHNFGSHRMTSCMKTVATECQLANVFTLISRSSPISLADSFLSRIILMICYHRLVIIFVFFLTLFSTHMSLVSPKTNIREICRKSNIQRRLTMNHKKLVSRTVFMDSDERIPERSERFIMNRRKRL